MIVPLAVDDAQAIGEQIKEARKAAGLTQAQLAEAIGVSRVQVTYYERGTQWPNVQRLVKICKTLGASADRILGIS